MDDKSADMENTIHCVEVRQSFKNSRSFYYSYLARSWCKTIFGLILFFILAYYGIPSAANNINGLRYPKKGLKKDSIFG